MRPFLLNGRPRMTLLAAGFAAVACSDSGTAPKAAPSDAQATSLAATSHADHGEGQGSIVADTLIAYHLGRGVFLTFERVTNTGAAATYTLSPCTLELTVYAHEDLSGTPLWQGNSACADHIVDDVPPVYVPSMNGDTTIYAPITGDGVLDAGKSIVVNGRWDIPLAEGTYYGVSTINGLFDAAVSTTAKKLTISPDTSVVVQPSEPSNPAGLPVTIDTLDNQ